MSDPWQTIRREAVLWLPLIVGFVGFTLWGDPMVRGLAAPSVLVCLWWWLFPVCGPLAEQFLLGLWEGLHAEVAPLPEDRAPPEPRPRPDAPPLQPGDPAGDDGAAERAAGHPERHPDPLRVLDTITYDDL